MNLATQVNALGVARIGHVGFYKAKAESLEAERFEQTLPWLGDSEWAD